MQGMHEFFVQNRIPGDSRGLFNNDPGPPSDTGRETPAAVWFNSFAGKERGARSYSRQ
jgi:hypothetical protein